MITSMRCDRIEKALAADPTAAKLLGPKTHGVFTPKNDKRMYCAEVMVIAQAIVDAGEDPADLTRRQIMGFAMPVLAAKMQGKPLPTIRPDLVSGPTVRDEKPKAPRAGRTVKPSPKPKAASAEPRRKKAEPESSTPAPESAPPAESEPEPEPEPEPPKPSPEPAKAAPKARVKLEPTPGVTLPYVPAVAINTLLVSALHIADQYELTDVPAYKLVVQAVTGFQALTAIPNPCAKEVKTDDADSAA